MPATYIVESPDPHVNPWLAKDERGLKDAHRYAQKYTGADAVVGKVVRK